MEHMFFVLNNTFSVDASLNLLTNNETRTQTKLEPRLIEILCVLAKNEGTLVSREMLISTIWNNYGGAEDGLNQGISFLRKALGDTNKQIIETVPKKGYILHASVTNNLAPKMTEQTREKKFQKKPFLIAVVSVVFILASLLLFNQGKKNTNSTPIKQPQSFLPSDSIVSKNWQGKHYKLIIGKNETIKLFENNIQIADSNLKNFEIVIQDLKDKFTSNQDAKRQSGF